MNPEVAECNLQFVVHLMSSMTSGESARWAEEWIPVTLAQLTHFGDGQHRHVEARPKRAGKDVFRVDSVHGVGGMFLPFGHKVE